MKATIIDNKVFCRVCGNELGNTKEYKQVEYQGESYTEFIRYCSQRNCRNTGSYLLDLRVDNSIRFVADENELIEVKDERE